MKSPSTLQIALGVSIAVHVVLLTVRFVDPERFNRVFQDTPLEVILVNAKSNEKPDFAKAIAQASLAGGGEAEKGRATSPLPPSALMELGDATEDAQRKVESLQEQQTQLLAQIKKQLASMPPPDLTQPANSPAQAEREEKRKALVKILAEIERRINEENARPKSATSARPRAKRSTPSITTSCAAGLKTGAPSTSPSRPAKSSTANSP